MRMSSISLRAAIIGVLASSGAVHAETGPTAVAASLEDVVVTATKREEKLKDVAMSVTAVSGEDLARRQETSFVDFAAQVPGLSLQAIDAGEIRLIIRGANVGSVGSTVATVVDDIPFSMSSSQADGAFFGANVDTYDMQRVEVLRGPQGTLYGATAEGGLIKYVTNAPDLHQFSGAVSVGASTVDKGSSVAMGQGYVNLPLADGRAALRLTGTAEGLPGWIDNPALGQRDTNGGTRYSLRGSLLVKPNDDLSIRATVFTQDMRVGGSNFSQVVGAAMTPTTPPPNQFQQVDGYANPQLWPHNIHVQDTFYALHVDYDMKFATLMSATSFGEINWDYDADIANSNVIPGVSYGEYFDLYVFKEPVEITVHQTEFTHKFNQEFRLTSNPGSTLFGHGFDWQTGVYFTRETNLLDQPYVARPSSDPTQVLPVPVGTAHVPSDYNEWALFADVTYHFTDRFDLELGGRQSGTTQDSQVSLGCCVVYGPTDTVYPAFNSSEHSHTWSVAPRFHFTPDTMVYARYATGYRPGGPNFPTPALPTPPNLLPDSTRNYELGLRSDFLDKRVSVDLAVFDIEWKNAQILTLISTPNGPIGINGNSGSARSRGVEWNFAFIPVSGLTLSLLGDYTNAKLSSDAPGLGAYSGEQLPYVPNVTVTLNADYTWHLAGNYNASVGASASRIGTQYTGFSPSPPVEAHVQLPDYTTLKLRAGIDNGRWNAQIYAVNLTNEKGITEYSNDGGAHETGQAAFIQPRTIGIQVGTKF